MFEGGYIGKLLRIDLSTRRYSVEEIEPEEYRLFLGGRGLGALWYWREIGPEVRPLGPENSIGFFTGPMTGIPLVSTTKLQLTTKGPETGHYLCSNSSGNFGPRLREAGFDALILEGISERWTSVVIEDDGHPDDGHQGDLVRFIDDDDWQGLNPMQAREKLLSQLPGGKWATMSIGPAAENGIVFSSLFVDDGRAFGRGGGGAVLASKRVKALAVRGVQSVPVADAARCKEIASEAREDLKTSRAKHRELGTAQLVEIINELGCMPTRNFQAAWAPPEQVEGVYAQTLHEHYYVRNYACYRCSVACGQMAEVKEGEFAGAKARPEYESIGLLGPSCGINSLDAVIAANEKCDELGMDTITAGNLVALVMELFERRLVTAGDNDGLEVRFGDGEALLRMLELIAERRGLGAILAGGAKGIINARPEWEPYVLHSKGLTFPAYDPRGFHGMGLSYATSARGACHNVGGYTVSGELLKGKPDRYAVEGKGEFVKGLQDNRAYIDSLGLCTVVRGAYQFTTDPASETLLAITGYDFAPHLMTIGERISTLERLIWLREGLDRSQDTLPPRMKEPIPDGPASGHFISDAMLNTMLDEYYASRGWDETGRPTQETLTRLELTELAS
jgi:aldehyde:ferredoxin oxidoreductase